MAQMKVRTKLYSIVGIMSIVLVIVGVVGLFVAKFSDDGLDSVYQDRVVPLEQLKVISDMYAVNIVDTSHKVRNGGLNWSEGRKNVDEALKTVSDKWKAYLATTLVPEEKKLVEEITPLMKKADEAVAKLKGLLVKEDKVGLAVFTISEMYPAIDPLGDKISALVNVQLVVAKKVHEESGALYEKGKLLSIILIIAGVLGSILYATSIIRGIMRELGGEPADVREVAEAVAGGDLTVTVRTDERDTGSVMLAMKHMTGNLRSIIGQVSATSSQVAAASSQLHSTAERIATGAEEVVAQAGTVATAGEEMSATSGDIAQNCQGAAEGAQRASKAALNGSAVVDKTVLVMGQIAEKVQVSARTVESLGARSDQIGDIIGTIEDIADQTNLLALNAAIEAARAGEQGRGFAVVADEVRALAERTTRATKEIGEMIKAIQKETKGAVAAMEQGVNQVEAGTEEAAKSGAALRDILEQINAVTMQVSQIATAAEEQTATTSEISNNMQQITEVVQQTSHGAHESATAAAQLSGNAEELQRLVRQFKL
ncbi:MAG: methyl-accepting chemotaxis protein [Desulfuromonadaceae bacterium]|nr:methyl-accepting chemotaxis protein [Desulfuromonadaceae bacterium]